MRTIAIGGGTCADQAGSARGQGPLVRGSVLIGEWAARKSQTDFSAFLLPRAAACQRIGVRSLEGPVIRSPEGEDAMTSPAIKLAPSILAADFARLGEQVRAAEQ